MKKTIFSFIYISLFIFCISAFLFFSWRFIESYISDLENQHVEGYYGGTGLMFFATNLLFSIISFIIFIIFLLLFFICRKNYFINKTMNILTVISPIVIYGIYFFMTFLLIIIF